MTGACVNLERGPWRLANAADRRAFSSALKTGVLVCPSAGRVRMVELWRKLCRRRDEPCVYVLPNGTVGVYCRESGLPAGGHDKMLAALLAGVRPGKGRGAMWSGDGGIYYSAECRPGKAAVLVAAYARELAV